MGSDSQDQTQATVMQNQTNVASNSASATSTGGAGGPSSTSGAESADHSGIDTKAQQVPYQHVAVLRLSALGDCINAFGVANALKQTYPEIDVSFIVDKRFAPLFIDEEGHSLLPLVAVDFSSSKLKAAAGIDAQITALNLPPVDILFDLQTSIKASLCAFNIKAKAKYGYDSKRSREGQSLFTNVQVPSPEHPHVISGFMAFAKHANLPIAKPVWDFRLSDELHEKMLSTIDLDLHRTVAISPCSAKEAKNWTLQGYMEVMDYLYSHGYEVVLLGGKSSLERDMCKYLNKAYPRSVNLQGQTSLRELACVLQNVRVLISPDAGSMHLASAVNTPVVAMFAIHDPKRVGPWNFMELNVSVYHEIATQELKGKPIPWRYRVKNLKAMHQISSAAVIAKLEQALSLNPEH